MKPKVQLLFHYTSTYYQMKTKNIPILPKCVQHITHVQGTVHKVKLNIISKIKSVQLYNSS